MQPSIVAGIPSLGRWPIEFLVRIFVGQPLAIVAVSIILLMGYLALRSWRPDQTSPWLLRAAMAWGAYSAWEFLVLLITPEADIRVDLLLIWPVLAIVTFWALFRAVR